MAINKYDDIKELIRNGRLTEAIRKLIVISNKINYEDAIIIDSLASQLNRHFTKIETGEILYNDNTEYNRITQNILRHINLMEEAEKANKHKENDNVKFKVFSIIVVLGILVFFANIFNVKTPKSEFDSLTEHFANSTTSFIAPKKYNLLKLSDSNALICKKLNCTPEQSDELIYNIEKYLKKFSYYFEKATNKGLKDLSICEEFNDGTIIQILDESFYVNTYHTEDFCDSLFLVNSYQNIRVKETNYEIERVTIKELKSENNSYKKRIRFVIKSKSRGEKCKSEASCIDINFNSTILINTIKINEKKFEHVIEAYLISNAAPL